MRPSQCYGCVSREFDTKSADFISNYHDIMMWDCRTPEALLLTISTVLNAYDAQLGGSDMMAESAALMNPEVIKLMRDLKQRISKQYT